MWQRGAVAEPLCWWRISVAVAIIPGTPALINGFYSYLDDAWGHSGVAVAGERRPWPCRNWYQYTHMREVDVLKCFFFFFYVLSHSVKSSRFQCRGKMWNRCRVARTGNESCCFFDHLQPKHTISKVCHHIWNRHFRLAVVPYYPKKKKTYKKNSSTVVL